MSGTAKLRGACRAKVIMVNMLKVRITNVNFLRRVQSGKTDKPSQCVMNGKLKIENSGGIQRVSVI